MLLYLLLHFRVKCCVFYSGAFILQLQLLVTFKSMMLHEDTYDKLLKYNTLLKIKPSQHFWFVTPHKKQSLVGVGGHVSDESVSFTKERFPLHTRDVLSFKGVK